MNIILKITAVVVGILIVVGGCLGWGLVSASVIHDHDLRMIVSFLIGLPLGILALIVGKAIWWKSDDYA